MGFIAATSAAVSSVSAKQIWNTERGIKLIPQSLVLTRIYACTHARMHT